VTRDVLDVSKMTGFAVLRKRYAGYDVVGRGQRKDSKIDSGLDDSEFRGSEAGRERRRPGTRPAIGGAQKCGME
jgi:hypothetical protein